MKLKWLLAFTSFLLSLFYMSCQFAGSPVPPEGTLSKASSTVTAEIRDADWEFKTIGKVPAEASSVTASCTKAGFSWVWSSRSIWTSEPGGSWRRIYDSASESPNSIEAIHLLSPQAAWKVKDSGLYKTTDGGLAWTRVVVRPLR